jgi:uncharacterized protein (TIGR02466 family)
MTTFPNKQSLWATNIYCYKDEDHLSKKEELLNIAYELKAKKRFSGVSDVAKKNLFESSFNFFDSKIQAVQDLKKFCTQSLIYAVQEANGYDIKTMNNFFPDLRESWTHITNNGGYHDAHVHLNTSWGGIYYLQASECGTIEDEDGILRMNGTNRFYSPIQYFALDPSMQYLRHSAGDVSPENGVLVIFPAYLLHSATPYSGKEDRVIISFNAVFHEKPNTNIIN